MSIPEGYIRVENVGEVFVGNGEVVVTGEPPEETEDDDHLKHNCDEMGCSSVNHVIFRAKIYAARYGCEETEEEDNE